MALQKTFTYEEAGNIELTGAYHRVREVIIEIRSPALATGDTADAEEARSHIAVDVFGTSDVRRDMATPIGGYQFDFPVASIGPFSSKDEIFTAAYNYMKTGHLEEDGKVFYSGAVDI